MSRESNLESLYREALEQIVRAEPRFRKRIAESALALADQPAGESPDLWAESPFGGVEAGYDGP